MIGHHSGDFPGAICCDCRDGLPAVEHEDLVGVQADADLAVDEPGRAPSSSSAGLRAGVGVNQRREGGAEFEVGGRQRVQQRRLGQVDPDARRSAVYVSAILGGVDSREALIDLGEGADAWGRDRWLRWKRLPSCSTLRSSADLNSWSRSGEADMPCVETEVAATAPSIDRWRGLLIRAGQ
ncbi:hypothetical protein [Micromonospora globbae]|uniref:hypothetical protein n=1 Tax=Micromonospora globbae TaxID=1894969 RepID=UPI00341898C6